MARVVGFPPASGAPGSIAHTVVIHAHTKLAVRQGGTVVEVIPGQAAIAWVAGQGWVREVSAIRWMADYYTGPAGGWFRNGVGGLISTPGTEEIEPPAHRKVCRAQKLLPVISDDGQETFSGRAPAEWAPVTSAEQPLAELLRPPGHGLRIIPNGGWVLPVVGVLLRNPSPYSQPVWVPEAQASGHLVPILPVLVGTARQLATRCPTTTARLVAYARQLVSNGQPQRLAVGWWWSNLGLAQQAGVAPSVVPKTHPPVVDRLGQAYGRWLAGELPASAAPTVAAQINRSVEDLWATVDPAIAWAAAADEVEARDIRWGDWLLAQNPLGLRAAPQELAEVCM